MYFWSSLDVRGIINVFLQDKVIKCSININALMCKMLVIKKEYKIIQQNPKSKELNLCDSFSQILYFYTCMEGLFLE